MQDIPRELAVLPKHSSVFLFGPRMTGKTTLLRKASNLSWFNLLDPETELSYKSNPETFWGELKALGTNNGIIVVDEIQKVPALLDYVQMGIDQLKQQFILSGSSARKLKRQAANLLGGRAIEKRLYPLSYSEIGTDKLNIDEVLSYGTLPKIYNLIRQKEFDEARQVLASYYTIYVKEEIQAEAITRNIAAFSRFLKVAAQSHGHVVEYANIAQDSKVPDSTVKEYFSILEDTLVATLLPQWDASERKKARSKFYFFDPGVVRAIQNRLYDPPTGQELGLLFEGWFVYELYKIRDYRKPYLEYSFWRQNNREIDVLIKRGNQFKLAIEIKSGTADDIDQETVLEFQKRFPDTELVVASRVAKKPRRNEQGVMIMPYLEVLDMVAGHSANSKYAIV